MLWGSAQIYMLKFTRLCLLRGGHMMADWNNLHDRWDSFQHLDPALRQQLDALKHDENSLVAAFYKVLTFGTGGMRGILGPGTNRMNICSVRKAVKGLA